MPIQLASPKNTGDLDPNTSQYTQVKIIFQSIDIKNNCIVLKLEYGNTVNGAWVPGILSADNRVIKNHAAVVINNEIVEPASADYDDIIASLPSNLEVPIYSQVAGILYQWLIDNGHFSGTIV